MKSILMFNTQGIAALSKHDYKIVDLDVETQNQQTTKPILCYFTGARMTMSSLQTAKNFCSPTQRIGKLSFLKILMDMSYKVESHENPKFVTIFQGGLG